MFTLPPFIYYFIFLLLIPMALFRQLPSSYVGEFKIPLFSFVNVTDLSLIHSSLALTISHASITSPEGQAIPVPTNDSCLEKYWGTPTIVHMNCQMSRHGGFCDALCFHNRLLTNQPVWPKHTALHEWGMAYTTLSSHEIYLIMCHFLYCNCCFELFFTSTYNFPSLFGAEKFFNRHL